MPEAPPEQAAGVPLRIVPTIEIGDEAILYANHVQVTFSPEDMTFHFGWYAIPPLPEPPTEAVEVRVRPVARVSVPLNLVRGVIAVLQSQVEGWEKAFEMTLQPHPNPPRPIREGEDGED